MTGGRNEKILLTLFEQLRKLKNILPMEEVLKTFHLHLLWTHQTIFSVLIVIEGKVKRKSKLKIFRTVKGFHRGAEVQ